MDGACSGNPGPGGWGAIFISGNYEKEISGASPDTTTNNRMELIALIEALKRLKYPCNVSVYSDSAYVINAFNKGWIDKWQHNGWMTASKPSKPVENSDLWKEIIDLVSQHNVSFDHVKGHAGIALNERADNLARKAIKK